VSPAFGAGFTLNLSAPSTPVVGQPMILQATGTIPPEDLPFLYWFSLDAIPTSVTSTCPEDHFVAKQLALSTGGSIVVLSQREVPDAAGNFSIPVGVTPVRRVRSCCVPTPTTVRPPRWPPPRLS